MQRLRSWVIGAAALNITNIFVENATLSTNEIQGTLMLFGSGSTVSLNTVMGH